MKKNLLNTTTAVLLACAFAHSSAAQEAPAQKKAGEAVRERRATAEPKAEAPAKPRKKDEAAKEDAPKSDATKDDAAKNDAAKPEAASGEAESASGEGEASAERAAEGDSAEGEGEDGAASGDEVEELRARLSSVSSRAERARLQHALVESLSRAGRKTEAVAQLRSMVAEERFDPPFFYNAGNALARLGESEAAVDAYRKAVSQRRGGYARAQHNLGVVLTRLGRWDEAEQALTAALKLENYTYAEASYSLGRLHQLRGDYALALGEWARTLRLKPDHAGAAVALARALSDGGDPEAGLAVLDSFNTRLGRRGVATPREVTVARGEIVAASNVASYVAVEAKHEGGDSVVAGSGASRSSSNPSASATVEERGLSEILRGARKGGDDDKPLVVTKQAFELLRRARAAREGERAEEAAALYRRAIESNGGYFAPANLELGYTLSGLRRDDEAIRSLLEVIGREGTKYPLAFYHLGRFYEHAGRLAPAAEAFARAAELMGDQSPQFLIDLSRVREREGNYAEALAAAERYVREAERAGGVPDWARARAERLRKKVGEAKSSAQAQPAKN